MWWIFACVGEGSYSAPAPPVESPPPPADNSVEVVPGVWSRGACADLYDPDDVVAFALEMDPEEWEGLEGDYRLGVKTYHPAVLRVGDESVDAQVRLKGNPDFSWWIDKMQFVVSFNEDDPDARFHGLRKLTFDAPWYD
jgi:hypothetical protein